MSFQIIVLLCLSLREWLLMTDFSFLFIQGTDYKRILKKTNVTVYAIILNRTNVFNINDKEMFLEHQISIRY